MDGRPSEGGGRLVGREAEQMALDAFLDAGPPVRALLLVGQPGIGKSSLWEAGVDAGRARGRRLLSARPGGEEAQLAFGGLIDVLDGVEADELAVLPPPQRRALEVALLRAEPDGPAAVPRAIGVGLLGALRALAEAGPLLVAVDDVQWLDGPSDEALAFAARRLEGEEVAFLLAARPGTSSALGRALERCGPERVEVGPLALPAMRRLLADRLGLVLRRPVLRRVVEAAVGNPLFALELGRVLAEQGAPALGEDVPVPETVEDLVGTRVSRLPPAVRRLLLAVALCGDIRASQLAALAREEDVEDAVGAGVVALEGDRLRPAHPLLAAAAKRASRAGERRTLHLELAAVVTGGERRALHLALATPAADRTLAAHVADAAATAAARGAREEAVVLAEHALRLTPASDPERPARVLALAEDLRIAGEPERLTEVLLPVVDTLPAGELRVRGCLLLMDGTVSGNDEIQALAERALAEAGDDPELRASVVGVMSSNTAAIRVERLAEAEAMARSALPSVRGAGLPLEWRVLHGLAWAWALRGRPIDAILDYFTLASDVAPYVAVSVERIAGQRLVWRGELREARAVLTRLLAVADEQGEAYSYALQRLHVCELELRVGACDAAEQLLDEWGESADRTRMIWPMYERCRALLAATRGQPEEAERWTADALAAAEARGIRWDALEALRARTMVALLAHDAERAAEAGRAVWAHLVREGVDEPGAFPIAPDLVEALAALGALDEAREAAARLARLADAQQHPWGRATARRCAAFIELAEPSPRRGATDELAGAAAAYGELGLGFDRARTLLALGRALRRQRRWGDARRALEDAAASFDGLGAGGWADEARAEHARLGPRQATRRDGLTRSEQRVVELAGEGLSNKEIAAALVVSVRTVEAHLTRAYQKLGVSSRAQLVRHLAERA